MDLFISYRRKTGSIYARIFADFFKKHGISFFLDTEGLHHHTGEFDPVLKSEIVEANDFLLILSPQVFDEIDENSVFLQEIETARENNKRIIPVLCGGFSFEINNEMPDKIRELSNYLSKLQCVSAVPVEFDRDRLLLNVLDKMTPTKARDRAIFAINGGTVLESRKIVEQREPLADRLSGEIESINICVLAGQGILSSNREWLENALEKGCKCKVVMLKPNCEAAKFAAKHIISLGSINARKRIIPNTFDDLMDWKEDWGDSFEGRVTDWYLPCSIFYIEMSERKKSTIKVDFYSFNCADNERRCVFIHVDDVENFEFYKKQFEYIWENSEAVERLCEND